MEMIGFIGLIGLQIMNRVVKSGEKDLHAIREYLPVNLILIFGFINVGIMLLRMYL